MALGLAIILNSKQIGTIGVKCTPRQTDTYKQKAER